MQKISVALEWFLNPDHLPFLVAIDRGYFEKRGLEVQIQEPDEHYDGFEALKKGEIVCAINEPLHLIEQFDDQMVSLGTFFQTKGGVMLTTHGVEKLLSGQKITLSTPVDNPKTDAIAREILRRYVVKQGGIYAPEQTAFVKEDFYHIKHIQEGYDGAWLVFDNFEGVEARQLGLSTSIIDAKEASYPNFSALDIYTTRHNFETKRSMLQAMIEALNEAIVWIQEGHECHDIYYRATKTQKSVLMDGIITATRGCFQSPIRVDRASQVEILNFFHSLGLSTLSEDQFCGAFLDLFD